MRKFLFIQFIILLSANVASSPAMAQSVRFDKENPTDYRKHMQWFSDAKFGMFIHFGLYSSLGGTYKGKDYEGYAEWIQSNANISTTEYSKLLEVWNPKDFDANKIVRLAKKAGMKYLVITTKHHEGFCLWDSEYTDFDIANTKLNGRDFIKELAKACKKNGIRFGTYYSIIDWHHESQLSYNQEEPGIARWSEKAVTPQRKSEYVKYMKNQIRELIENYDTDILWFDGDWVSWWTMEDGIDLYNYIRQLKPSVIVNNRVAKRDVFKRDFDTPEQFHPGEMLDYYWEACYTLNDSWGYKTNDHNWKSAGNVIVKLKDINSKGGNLLLNVGPDGNGVVPRESVEILKEVGKALKKR